MDVSIQVCLMIQSLFVLKLKYIFYIFQEQLNRCGEIVIVRSVAVCCIHIGTSGVSTISYQLSESCGYLIYGTEFGFLLLKKVKESDWKSWGRAFSIDLRIAQ